MTNQSLTIKRTFLTKRGHSDISIEVVRHDSLESLSTSDTTNAEICSILDEAIIQISKKIHLTDSMEEGSKESPIPATPAPSVPSEPLIKKLSELDYGTVGDNTELILSYNRFSFTIFDESSGGRGLLRAICSINTPLKTERLEHIAHHLEINDEEDCGSYIGSLCECFGIDSFKLMILASVSKSPILADFITNGTNVGTIRAINAHSGNDEMTFLINEMGLMKTKLNMDVIKEVIENHHSSVALGLLNLIRIHLYPMTASNCDSVNKIRKFIEGCQTKTSTEKTNMLTTIFGSH